jgi:hypothetical protein
MPYEFISQRDFETAPQRYANYLRDTQANARRTLQEPEQKWPRGSSHDISRQIIDECQEAYEELVLDFGVFDAHGRLVEFAEA